MNPQPILKYQIFYLNEMPRPSPDIVSPESLHHKTRVDSRREWVESTSEPAESTSEQNNNNVINGVVKSNYLNNGVQPFYPISYYNSVQYSQLGNDRESMLKKDFEDLANERPFKCNLCWKSFYLHPNLYNHLINQHGMLLCEKCGHQTTFKLKEGLSQQPKPRLKYSRGISSLHTQTL